MFEMKMTSNGRRPQIIKCWISQRPLIWSSSNSKLRPPPMEDDLKLLKVEYLNNHRLYLPWILNLSRGGHRRARLILPYQARFNISSHLFKQHLNFKQDLRIQKIKISISSKVRESKIQNLDNKQDSRMTKDKRLAANETKIHLQNVNLH